eukprot:7947808-Prorocentrum_lima.AAC.1
MTSSLVGSEMCIRDRGDLCCGKDVAQVEGGCVTVRPLAWFCRDAFHAVSYTHLTLPTICSV